MLLHLNEIDPLPKLGAKVQPKPEPLIVAAKSYDWNCAMPSDTSGIKAKKDAEWRAALVYLGSYL